MQRALPLALGFACLAVCASCDPVWRVNTPATATGRIEPACLDTGLREVSPSMKTSHAIDRSRFEFMLELPATEPHAVHVVWQTSEPSKLELEVRAVGTQANPKAVAGFRAVRGDVVASVERSCSAKVTLGTETCQRCD